MYSIIINGIRPSFFRLIFDCDVFIIGRFALHCFSKPVLGSMQNAFWSLIASHRHLIFWGDWIRRSWVEEFLIHWLSFVNAC